MPNPRKSVEQHVLDGTYRRDRHGPLPGEDAASTATKPPEKPCALEGSASAVWDELIDVLGGVVTDRDTLLLSELCGWWAELKRVKEKLAATEPGEKGYNSLLVAAGICTDKLDKIAARFGLTPADRAKLKVESGPPVARVPTRPKTRLDALGRPGGA